MQKWTLDMIEQGIRDVMGILQIDRMPTSTEVKDTLGRNDLHIKISRTKKYSGWAEYLGLSRKQSDTVRGQAHEQYITDKLTCLGHTVQQMTTKHPYDLLVDGTVKVDVKSGKAYLLHGSRAHSFGISKKDPTCDIYIIVAMDEQDQVERTLIIPSHLLRVSMLCIGTESKYNRFIDRWDYIRKYSAFLKDVV